LFPFRTLRITVARPKQLRLLVVITLLWLAWSAWFVFSGGGVVALEVVDEDGVPVVGATVERGDEAIATTDAEGLVEVDWGRGVDSVEVSAPGFAPATIVRQELSDAVHTVRMNSNLLRGVVIDGDGRPVEGVYVSAGFGESVTGLDGHFTIRKVEPGPVRVWRPAWVEGDFDWDGSPGQLTVSIEPRVVKAVHVTGEVAGDPARWEAMLDLKDRTELNGVMLDLKDEYGLIYYESKVETAIDANALYPTYDLAQIARDVADRGLYLIGRIVTFQDPQAARRIPDIAAFDPTSGGPYSKNGQWFLDPTDPGARGYALSLAEEACRLGVDEIQFDYVRFPDGRPDYVQFDGPIDETGRIEAIRTFLLEARALLHPLGCAVAGDIFGFITTAQDDGGIGQQWEVVTQALDVVSPMLYPSHYASGWYSFDRPNDHPGEMIRYALEDGISRLKTGTIVRPWLQDFGYTDAQVRAQIDSAEEFGLGWMLWNAFSNVSVGALDPS
jgi:hypothetical protein